MKTKQDMLDLLSEIEHRLDIRRATNNGAHIEIDY